MENDLISRSALLDDILAAAENAGMGALVAGTLRRYVLRRPAIDAVEVVRCKDCKWLYRNSEMCCCKKHTGLAAIKKDGSGFCSYGERRVGDGK